MHQPITVWIGPRVIRELITEANLETPFETGGVLLGYWSDSDSSVVVQDHVGAGPQATRGRGWFVPDAEYQEDEIAIRYEASGRRTTYLGDWHSHPNGTTTLSRRDRRTLRGIAKFGDARAANPLMVVLAGGEPWRFGVWQLRRGRLLRTMAGGEPTLIDTKWRRAVLGD